MKRLLVLLLILFALGTGRAWALTCPSAITSISPGPTSCYPLPEVSGTRALIYAAIVPNGNSSTSVAVAPSTAGCTVSGQEWAGFTLSLDGTNSGKQNGGTAQASGSITTTRNGDLVLAFAEKSSTTGWTGPGAPWNTIDNFVGASPALNSVFQIANVNSFNPSWSWTSAANSAAAIAAFVPMGSNPIWPFWTNPQASDWRTLLLSSAPPVPPPPVVPPQPEHWPFWIAPQCDERRPYTITHSTAELGNFTGNERNWPFWLGPENDERRPYVVLHQSTELGNFKGAERHWPWWNTSEADERRPYTMLHQSTELGNFSGGERNWPFWLNLAENEDRRPFVLVQLSAEIGTTLFTPGGWSFWLNPQQYDSRVLAYFVALINAGIVPPTPGGLDQAIVIWRNRGGY